MAKGDDKRARTQIDKQDIKAQNAINLAQGNLTPQNQQAQNLFTQASERQMGDYGNIMDQYKNFAAQQPANVTARDVTYSRDPSVANALAGYQKFADTGGYSDQDVTDIRARGIAPIRAVYANMMNEMQRQKNLSGGYSPNFNAAATKMRGSTSQQVADNVQNVNAQLADAIRQGKLAGLEGLGTVGLKDSELAQQAMLANAANSLTAAGINNSANNARLGAIEGQRALFGTNPGLMQTTGQQVTNSNAQNIDLAQLQKDLGLGLIGGQINAGQLAGNWENNMQRVKDVAGVGGAILGMF